MMTPRVTTSPVDAVATSKDMNLIGKCTKLRVTQVGGIAGNVAMPPLIDLDRRMLDEHGGALMDAACDQLIAAYHGVEGSEHLGADLPGYRVETEDEQNRPYTFSLGGPETHTGLDADADVPLVLAPLLALPQAPGHVEH
ncbi:MAG: hypothetical protein V4595_06745 [Pseudomonadota bacterium]